MSVPIRTIDQSWLLPFEGVDLLLAPGEAIEAGDLYLAKRNMGWKLLTCKQHNREDGYILAVEPSYPYDTLDCWKVLDIREKLTR